MVSNDEAVAVGGGSIGGCLECDGPWVACTEEGTTLVGFSSPPGHDHDDNCRKRVFTCVNGHQQAISVRQRCPVEECDWAGKLVCFCHSGEKVDAYPEIDVARFQVHGC